jgi:hypothetical protein
MWCTLLPNASAASPPGSHAALISFDADSSHGYQAEVTIWRHRVQVALVRAGASVEYLGRAEVSGGHIVATLGSRVAIDLRLHGPTLARLANQSGRCMGQRFVERTQVVLIGQVLVAGEHGFSTARLGRVVASLRRSCRRPRLLSRLRTGDGRRSVSDRSSVTRKALTLRSRIGGKLRKLNFVLFSNPAGQLVTVFGAVETERRRGFLIRRGELRVAGAGSVRRGRSSGEVLVLTPPAPFRGQMRIKLLPRTCQVLGGGLAVQMPDGRTARLLDPKCSDGLS